MPRIRIKFRTFSLVFFTFVSNGSMFNSTNRQPSIGFNEIVKHLLAAVFAYSFSDFHLRFVFGTLLMPFYSLFSRHSRDHHPYGHSIVVILSLSIYLYVCVYVCLIIWSCWLSQFQIIALAICDIHTHALSTDTQRFHFRCVFPTQQSMCFLSALSHHGG